jgi:hypothetical protein
MSFFYLHDRSVYVDDAPETVKMKLKQWAQVVALSMINRR